MIRRRQDRTITTLTLESREARFLTVHGGRVASWGSAALPEGAVEAGALRDVRAVAPVVDRLFREHGLDRQHAVVGLGGEGALPLGLALPPLEGEALAKAVRDASERLMPAPPDSLYIHWQVVSQEPDALRVYVLGVPRRAVDRYVEVLRAARIRPYVMDLKALAVIRVARARQAVVAHLEHDYVELGIVVDSMPVALRTAPLRLGREGMSARLDALLEAAGHLIEEYQQAHQQAPVHPEAPLLVSGQVLLSQEALDYLASRGWRPVAPIASPIPFPQTLSVDRYIAHVGLALKSV